MRMVEKYPINSIHKIRIRFVFLGFGFLLFLQIVLTRIFGEPYPAIMMPAFGATGGPTKFRGKAPGKAWQLKPVVYYFEKDGRAHTISWPRLLSKIPNSNYGTLSVLLQDMLEEPSQPSSASIASPSVFENFYYSIFPGYRYNARHKTNAELHASLALWMKKKGEEIIPRASFQGAEIVWYTPTNVIAKRMKIDFVENKGEES